MRCATVAIAIVGLALASGCADAQPVEDEVVGNSEDAVAMPNALYPNALYPNALYPNALYPNALYPNALYPNALDPEAMTALESTGLPGDLSRMFVRYAVACAFKATQSFAFSWTDADGVEHDELYPGQLGVAPEWATGPLDGNGQRMVSACMAALTNYYGVHVLISLRSGQHPLRLNPWSQELHDYSRVEGAFWGNLFAEQPYLKACYNTANVSHSQSLFRDCSYGHVLPDGTKEECGIIDVVGSCQQACRDFNIGGRFYNKCAGSSGPRTRFVITTALP